MESAYRILEERGFIQQCSNPDGLRSALDSGPVTFYVGFDPTGTSLHVGHLVPLMAMAHLQRAGHRPIALIGGGTARIGDPSGKTETRKMLTVEAIKRNAENFRRQISQFLDFSEDRALMIDNADWLAELNYIDFLREIGKHFSVNRMLSFEAYKQRLEKGLSFIEFNYQLLQSYDYLILNRDYVCTLQMGGDDQWGNIVSGIELVRRIAGKEVFALTSPLVTRSDGKKMGKTEKGALFLDPALVSPYDFFQYWINVPDNDTFKFLSLFTFLPMEELNSLSGLKDAEVNRAKEILALELTSIVHGRKTAEEVQRTSREAFGAGDGADLAAMPTVDVSFEKIEEGLNVVDLFAQTGLCESKGEARRLITQGGAYVNNVNIRDTETMVGMENIRDGMILLRAGKKRYFKVVIIK
ncbi:MAG TPA: tyrosine--tRNA ligase [Spirochaetia bacterium]|nr:tyrosine--tRNA ligase [Spirochaetia bacterium]